MRQQLGQIQIRLFDTILQNSTWVDTYIFSFDNCFLSMVKFDNCCYEDPYWDTKPLS